MKKLSLGLASIVIALAATPDDATLRKMAYKLYQNHRLKSKP